MAPPLPALPELVGTLALSFTGAARAEAPEPTPTVQRPATPPTATSPSTPEPPSTPSTTAEEPSTPTPPVLPDPPASDEPPQPEPSTPPPSATVPPQPEPMSTTAPPMVPVASDDDLGPAIAPPAPRRVNLLAATEKRFFFDLFVGGTRALRGGYSYFPGMDFKLEGTIGGHGKRNRQLGGAAVVQLTYGLLNNVTVGPRLQWDKPLLDSHALFMHTNIMLAYRATTYGYYGLLLGLGSALHSALFGVGWGVKAIVADRLSLNFRPVNFSISGPGFGIVQLDWDVVGGLGVVW